MITKMLCCLFILLNGGFMNSQNNSSSICDYFSKATKIATYTNDGKSLYFKGDDKFEAILNSLLETTADSHDMPAFGVAFDNQVSEAKKKDTWLELIFDSTQYFNDMPFDALLIKVQPKDSGFNLIRKHDGKYEGRCFYLNLSKNMTDLSQKINEISK